MHQASSKTQSDLFEGWDDGHSSPYCNIDGPMDLRRWPTVIKAPRPDRIEVRTLLTEFERARGGFFEALLASGFFSRLSSELAD
jgi:hypothetical protein